MSSVFSDPMYGGAFSSWKANDGNNDTLARKVDNSCIHTQVQADPWWAVDLGAALHVVGVLFTNRAENWGNNMPGLTLFIANQTCNTTVTIWEPYSLLANMA